MSYVRHFAQEDNEQHVFICMLILSTAKFRKKERKTERKRENAAWIEIKPHCTPFNHFKIFLYHGHKFNGNFARGDDIVRQA